MKQTNFFTSGSPFLSHPLLTPERTTRELDFILSKIELENGARILDVGCGAGRHSLELASRGYKVVGIDSSETMITTARSRSVGIEPAPEFIQVSAEDFKTNSPFDASICLFTTLGQMEGARDNRQLVSSVFNAIRPGGHFIVEVTNQEWIKRNLKTSERFGDDTHYTKVSRNYDPERQIVEEVFKVVSAQAEKKYLLRYRVFSQSELHEILQEAGFLILDTYGGYEGEPLTEDSSLMIIFARKPRPRGV